MPPRTAVATRLGRAEAALTGALRSPAARWIGLVVGLAAIVALVARLRGEDVLRSEVLRSQTPLSWTLALCGFMAFQCAAALSLRLLSGRPSGRIWVTAQLVKYLPAPGSAMVGMIGSAVRDGYDARAAMGLMWRHTFLLAGAALVVGSPAGALALERWTGDTVTVLVGCGLAGAGVAIGALSARGSPGGRPWTAFAVAMAAWLVVGAALWATTAGRPAAVVTVVTAFPAAWLVGMAALPVPAGIGVREAVLVLLLQPVLGSEGAVAFGIVSRVLHTVSDGLAAAVVLPLRRRRRLDQPSSLGDPDD